MTRLDLSSQKSSRNGAAVPLTPHTISPVEPTTLSGIGTSNDSVFHLADLFTSLTITQPSAAVAAFGTGSRVYITVSMAIYLLSNNLVDPYSMYPHGEFFETLESVFAEIPARHLRALLQSRLANVRGAFEALLDISGVLKQPFAFKSLMEIGTGNNWLSISASGHKYLYYAVCMELDEIVQQLLESGCRPDNPVPSGTDGTNSMVTALERRNIRCVKLLLKHCDVNSNIQCQHGYAGYTIFSFFIKKTFYLDEMLFGQGIKLFLDAGADINGLIEEICRRQAFRWQQNRIWSVLDYLFCFHPRLFYKFAPNWSPAQVSQPTRAGILMSLEFGPNMLSEYCNRLAQNVGWASLYEYLELLVAEQLTGIGPWISCPRRVVNLETVRALVELGVSMDKVLCRAPCLLADYMVGRVQDSDRDCDTEVVQYLLDHRAIVDDRALQQAVRWQDTGLLELLIQNTVDSRQQGAGAVVKAAVANNFEAVEILLDAGVDVNTDFVRNSRRFRLFSGERSHETASLLCQVVELWTLPFEDLNIMIDFLVRRGAHFRLSAMKPRLSDFMESVLKSEGPTVQRPAGLLKAIVHYIVDMGCDLIDSDVPSARVLEACGYTMPFLDNTERLEIFKSMFRSGALLRPGAPLAAWVGIGGGVELVNEMLCGGVDIDAYHHAPSGVKTALQAAANMLNEKLVVLLLQKGADVNAPARGWSGSTALQAICICNPKSSTEKAQQISIINLLLAYGAKINAAPARSRGRTALQGAAEGGNLEVTMLLLSYDPPADVNAPPCQFRPGRWYSHGNALDLAARFGRIDVVKLLLNNDALSSCPGRTGYDGAIQVAEKEGWLAVADLIRQHATDVLRSNTRCTNLPVSQQRRDWHEHGYDDYSDGYTTLPEDDSNDEDSEDNESAGSREEQDSVAQEQIQLEAFEYPGPEYTAPEPGWISDMEADNSLNLENAFGNLADDTGSIYGLDYAPLTSTSSTAAFF